ncbi:MAG: type II toxin-antitoxin system RelE/ParE family toxin [Spirochaetales bacterium]|nr:type II toxin-antitoxin system RelE/ParE family toxin [Spirochaetales bacterium]
MKYSVQLVREAERDILEIIDYITVNDSAKQAEYVLDKLQESLNSLSDLPERGHYLPELERVGVKDYREIFFKSYRIIYRVLEHSVLVHSVLDGRRDMSVLLEKRMLR